MKKAGLSHYDKPSLNGWEGYRPDEMFWNDEHEVALLDGTLKCYEDPQCENCGWKFPPMLTWQEKRYVYCARWHTQKEKTYSCKAWTRPGHVSCKPPFWCDKDGNRLTQQQIHNNHKPQAVRERLTLSQEQRVIKHIRELQDQHISITSFTCAKLEQPLTNSQRWRLYLKAKAQIGEFDRQIDELKRNFL